MALHSNMLKLSQNGLDIKIYLRYTAYPSVALYRVTITVCFVRVNMIPRRRDTCAVCDGRKLHQYYY